MEAGLITLLKIKIIILEREIITRCVRKFNFPFF